VNCPVYYVTDPNALHQADNLMNTVGLVAFNNYNLWNLRPLVEVKKKFDGRIVLFACDYTPIDYKEYFREIASLVSPRGLIIDSQYSPVVGLLRGGQYSAIRRDLASGREAAFKFLSGLLWKN